MYGTFKQADPRSAADKRAQILHKNVQNLNSTTLLDGSRLPEKFHASLVQFRYFYKHIEQNLNLKTQYASDIRGDVGKGYVVPVSPHDSNNRSEREWYVPHQPA